MTKTSDANQGAKLKKRRARHLMDGRTRTRASLLTMAVIGHLSKNYLKQISILGPKKCKIRKNKDTMLHQFSKLLVLLLGFFVFENCWCLNLRFVPDNFWTKIDENRRNSCCFVFFLLALRSSGSRTELGHPLLPQLSNFVNKLWDILDFGLEVAHKRFRWWNGREMSKISLKLLTDRIKTLPKWRSRVSNLPLFCFSMIELCKESECFVAGFVKTCD